METWTNLCRCCLSPESDVWLLDEQSDVKDKFFEVTTLEVSEADGLPQRLCIECFTAMNTAYQFRMQCIKMDAELKIQQETINNRHQALVTKNENANSITSDLNDVHVISDTDENNPVNEILSMIKKEPSDNDDDCYYVLVIDDPKDQEAKGKVQEEETPIITNIKTEVDNNVELITGDISSQPEDSQDSQQEQEPGQQVFDNSYNSFLNTKVPVNVPATILENEEEYPENEEHYDNIMDVEEIQDSNSQSGPMQEIDDSQDKTVQIEVPGDLTNLQDKNALIKLLTSARADGTILIKGEDGIQYIADTHLVTTSEDGEADVMNQAEVIYCDEESSQYQILKCDDSELVIEYADGDQIATVLQQEDGTFLCDCGEEFDDLTEYEKHQHKHNPAGDHLCNLCGKGFESPEILTGHMLLHSCTGLLVSCPFCNQLIKRNALTQHIKYSHNNIKPQCNLCDKTFANPNNLKRHMMIHSGVRDFECDICLKRFHQKITMQTHRLTHMNPFACNQCDETFDNKTALTDHKESNQCTMSKIKKVKEELMKTVKQEITTSLGKLLGYACSLCKKMFSLENAFEQHVESTHMTDPSDLLCSECGEVIPSKREMQSHILRHKTYKNKNAKRFECSDCGKACSSQAMLIMHERVHTNERPYPCALCSLRFKTKTHLRTHQLTHTREKKFGCSVCMKFFALKGNLVVHLRTHTGERPYVCSICNEAFIDSKYLKKHKLKKHAIDNVPWNQY